jgi:hypothetical protein
MHALNLIMRKVKIIKKKRIKIKRKLDKTLRKLDREIKWYKQIKKYHLEHEDNEGKKSQKKPMERSGSTEEEKLSLNFNDTIDFDSNEHNNSHLDATHMNMTTRPLNMLTSTPFEACEIRRMNNNVDKKEKSEFSRPKRFDASQIRKVEEVECKGNDISEEDLEDHLHRSYSKRKRESETTEEDKTKTENKTLNSQGRSHLATNFKNRLKNYNNNKIEINKSTTHMQSTARLENNNNKKKEKSTRQESNTCIDLTSNDEATTPKEKKTNKIIKKENLNYSSNDSSDSLGDSESSLNTILNKENSRKGSKKETDIVNKIKDSLAELDEEGIEAKLIKTNLKIPLANEFDYAANLLKNVTSHSKKIEKKTINKSLDKKEESSVEEVSNEDCAQDTSREPVTKRARTTKYDKTNSKDIKRLLESKDKQALATVNKISYHAEKKIKPTR